MMNGYTPGPWRAEQGTVNHAGKIVVTAEHAGMTSNTPLARLADFDDAAWPDARLIAAAPDLYEALRLILPLAIGYRPPGQSEQARRTCDGWLAIARTAIAKADGASADEDPA